MKLRACSTKLAEPANKKARTTTWMTSSWPPTQVVLSDQYDFDGQWPRRAV
jgi:hypothetical protein